MGVRSDAEVDVSPENLGIVYDVVAIRCARPAFVARHALRIHIVDVVPVRLASIDVQTREVGELRVRTIDGVRLERRSVRANLVCRAVDLARIVVAEVFESLFLLLRDAVPRIVERILVQEVPTDEKLEPAIVVKVGDGGVEGIVAAILHTAL